VASWLTTSQVAYYECVDERQIRRWLNKNKYEYHIEHDTGNIRRYLINPNTMSEKARKAYLKELSDTTVTETSKPEPITRIKTKPDTDVLGMIVRRYGEDNLAKIVDSQELAKEVLAIKRSRVPNRTKIIKDLAKERGVSVATLYRRVDLYLKYGQDGLIHGNVLHQIVKMNEAPLTREYESFNLLAQDYIIVTHLSNRKYSVQKCYDLTVKEAQKNNWKIGSYQTACRIIQDIPLTYKDYHRRGKDFWRLEHMTRALRQDPEFNNEVWEADHTRMDFFINYEGRALRPWLTMIVDARSRCIVGWCVSTQANSETIGLAYRYAILPKKGSSPIYGVPRFTLIDNGTDFISKRILGNRNPNFSEEAESNHLQGLFERLEIIAITCAIHNGPGKGRIERKFRDVNSNFYRDNPGWCGASPKERPEDFDEKKLLKENKLASFEQVIEDFKVFIDGLNNAYHSEIGMTPIEKYLEGKRWKEEVPSPRMLDMWLLRGAARIVRKTGIMFKGNIYDDPIKLCRYSKEQINIYYDPADMNQIYACDDEGNLIGELPLKERRDYITSAEETFKHIAQQKKTESMVKNYKKNRQDRLDDAGSKHQKRTHKAATGENNEPVKVVQLSQGETTAKEISKARNKKTEPEKPEKFSYHDAYVKKLTNPIIDELVEKGLIRKSV